MLCGTCNTENRDAAKFCKGCGRKIAQAWPQAVPAAAGAGDAALLAGPLATAPHAAVPAAHAADAEALRPSPAPARARVSNGRWIGVLGLGIALLVAAAGWWGHRNRSQEIAVPAVLAPVPASAPILEGGGAPAGTPASASAPAEPASAAAPAVSAPAPADVAGTPEPAPAAKPTAAASPKPRKSSAKKAPAAPAPAVEAAAPPPAPAPEPVRVPSPQETCAGRNFIARAQCMAQQCARPEVASHPQCEAVRQQQRIEEEKRNPTMAG